MSREVVSRALLNFLVLSATAFNEARGRVLPDECFSPYVEDVENYLSSLDLQDIPTVNVMIGGFECPTTTLPFGALKSDWARLVMLREAQPEGSVLRDKLDRLFLILAIAYDQRERSDDVETVGSTEGSAKAGSERIEDGKDGLHSPEEKKTTGIYQEDIAARSTFARERYRKEESTERITSPGIEATETKEHGENTLSEVQDFSSSTSSFSEMTRTTSGTSLHSEADRIEEEEEHTTDLLVGSTVTADYTNDRSNIAASAKVSPDASVILSEQTSPFEEKTTEIGDTSNSTERNEIYTTRWMEKAETSGEHLSTEGVFATDRTATEESKVDGKLESTTKTSKPLIDDNVTNGLVTADNYDTTVFSTVGNDGEETTEVSSIPPNTESFAPSISTSTNVDDRIIFTTSTALYHPDEFSPETTPTGSDDWTSVAKTEETSPTKDSDVGSSVADQIETTTAVVFEEDTVRFENDDSTVSSSTTSRDGETIVPATGSVSSEFSPTDYSVSETLPVEGTATTTSSLPRQGKLKKLVVIERPPACNDFWRRVAFWRTVRSTFPVATARTGVGYPEDEARSRKRGSPNADFERSFRWFYGLYRSNATADGRSIDVDCGEKGATSLPP